MVEQGDLTQEVRFMGEFSTAFNNMVRKLDCSLSALRKQEEALRGEMELRDSAVEALQESEARFKYLASHDSLTGALNRRSFVEKAMVELKRAAEHRIPCCLVLMDIDHFKNFNDTYGHLAGDKVLESLAITIKQAVRLGDIPSRFGGEEFMILLSNTPRQTAWMVAERLRVSISEMKVSWKNPLPQVTISIGVVSFDKETNVPADELIRRADEALYQSKEKGRNMTTVWGAGLLFKIKNKTIV
jgi:diguanylate cyclase (GGDEF)-like protein